VSTELNTKRCSHCGLTKPVSSFDRYKAGLKTGEEKINASVLFPHQVLLQASHDPDIANAQFDALPNYMQESGLRIMIMRDGSGSMCATIDGDVTRNHACKALALYCSDRLGETNPFYRKYMVFASNPEFIDWRGQLFSTAARASDTRYAGSTNIQASLDQLLSMGQMFSISPDQMVNCLMIISDMQFDANTRDRNKDVDSYGGEACEGTESTVVESCMDRWEQAGYERPGIIYWNVAGYAGQPATLQTPNTALVSGFSPSILQAVLGGEDFNPLAIMRRTMDQYDDVKAPQ